MESLRRHISNLKGDRPERSSPGIPIETHYNTLDSSAFGSVRAFTEQLVYLFLCCVEAQVTNLLGSQLQK